MPISRRWLRGSGVLDPVGMPWLEECLQEFPETVFVGHGPGWWAEISGDVTEQDKSGYPDRPVVPGGSIDRLLAQYPNLHADLSAGSALNAFRRDLTHAREFLLRHWPKLMWGTDRFVREEDPEMIGVLRGMDLPAEVEQAVFRGNAVRMLGL